MDTYDENERVGASKILRYSGDVVLAHVHSQLTSKSTYRYETRKGEQTARK